MLIFPAIDLIEGECVRLTQGDYNQKKIYSKNPLEVARGFEKAGAKFLHIVDLDGAKEGIPLNTAIIEGIVKNTNLCVQVGGGIRTIQDVKRLFEVGVDKVIIGTSAIENISFLRVLLKNYGSKRIIVSIDVKNGMIATNGWLTETQVSIQVFLDKLKEVGINEVIYTDIACDGMLEGLNIESIQQVIQSGMNVTVAGGISNMGDLQALQEAGVFGAIIGKALYEGYIYCEMAVKSFQKNNLAKRIIPCMDINSGRVVKGTNFIDLKDAGDPVELAKKYSELGADELVFLDITATLENRKTLSELVRKISENINIPFTVGGGISSIDDIRLLLQNGADKVSIGSAAMRNSQLVADASREFGNQCVVISVDAKKNGNSWDVFIDGGRTNTGIDVVWFACKMQELGAGELLVNSLDRDGIKQGYDIELLSLITNSVSIPVIASSGAGSMEDFLEVFQKANVNAALAASVFHFEEIQIKKLKSYLQNNSIIIRS